MGEYAGTDAGQQRFDALQRANRVRLARAALKRQICNGDLSAAEVFRSCPWPAYKMEVSEVLMCQKRWGIQRCRRLLLPIGIPENKEVGTLTDRQRVALVGTLEEGRKKPGSQGEGRSVASPPPGPAPPAPLAASPALRKRRVPAAPARELSPV